MPVSTLAGKSDPSPFSWKLASFSQNLALSCSQGEKVLFTQKILDKNKSTRYIAYENALPQLSTLSEGGLQERPCIPTIVARVAEGHPNNCARSSPPARQQRSLCHHFL
jgi:hypothetical protein